MQIYMRANIDLGKGNHHCGTEKGDVLVQYTTNIHTVIEWFNHPRESYAQIIYEFPQMKQVTQAEVKIS